MPSVSPAPVLRVSSTVVLLLTLCALSSPVPAQVVDPSVQSAGMGGASVAAFWLDQPNVYINPALAGFQRGVTYSYGTTEIPVNLPFLFSAPDIKFQTHQILVGARGVGLEITGKPIESLGRLRADYGPTEVTDIDGNVIGEANVIEDIRTLAIGVDVIALIASFQEASSGEPAPIRNRLSVAFGHAWKNQNIRYEPDFGFEESEEDVKDIGALVRFAALDQIGSTLGEASQDTKLRLEVAGAYSEQNWDEGFGLKHYGASVRLTIAPPTSGEGWLADFGSPSIGLGLLWTGVDEGSVENTNLFGAEATVYDILYLRGGLVDENFSDSFPGLDDFRDPEPSFGGGVKLHYRKTIGVRFDYARFPFGILGGEVDRFQASVFLDPVRIWKQVGQ